ncbi:sushi, von Willebrand factor type A, EGF and pentraxin domain-containing protein 1-like [Diadema antillarum]|uniref:sushi, von Willebrand factor type A, EGF and pentraxin domain-containing protein 1-like n=1 Tax=Diadema antillarum TaxID=105358 RepID=UPI003A88EFC9
MYGIWLLELGCNALSRPFAELQSNPEYCFGSGKVPTGTTCTLRCTPNLTFQGDLRPLTCLSSGDWSDEIDLFSLECKDTEAPYITSCPTEPITAIRTEIWGVQVTFDPPTAEDKVTTELRVTTYPPDLGSPYNFTSDTTCRYTFRDSANNSASCDFDVLVTNEVTPEITYCPPGRNITTDLFVSEVFWEKPTYLDVPDIELQVFCNIADNPIRLPLGDHQIVCYVVNPESQLQAECTTDISLRPMECIPLQPPTNGFLACDEFASGRFCSVLCNDQHDIPPPLSRSIPALYVCGMSGNWLPSNKVPDCTSKRVASRLNLPLDVMYFDGDCSNKDGMREAFIAIFRESNFAGLCAVGYDCTVDQVSISCGPMDSWRKRSILAEKGLDSHGSDVINTATVSIVVGVNPNNSLPGNPPSFRSLTMVEDITAYVQQRTEEIFRQNGEAQGTEGPKTPGRYRTSLRFGPPSIECDHGYVADNDKHICIACPAGYFAQLKANECALCGRGFYQDQEGQTECKSCPVGTTTAKQGASDVSQCEVPCQTGTYSVTGFAPCFMCKKGWYQPITGQSECRACPDGMTTPQLGAVSPDTCREP